MTAKSVLRLNPTKALNSAYQKQKLGRNEIDLFKHELIALLNQVEDDGLEEFVKNALSDFLKNTWYKGKHYINIKERKDLVIHHEDKPKSEVGVIIEAKAPKNKSEMVSQRNLNTKALQELLLYYFTERIGVNNKSIKHLIVTNVNEWFVFDEIQFEQLFAQNKKLVEAYKAFEREKRSTDYFYKEIAQEYIAKVADQLTYTYFDIRKYEKPLRDSEKKNDKKLIALYKLLSPEHLLKLPFANDSNQLDRKFYSELLHIIGLSEEKEKGKKLIQRCAPEKRNEASLLEAAIIQLDALDKLGRLNNVKKYGENRQEQLFNVGLELSITWINRVLFLKLLEGQLLTYNKGNEQYKFLDFKHINNYDDLNTLFFQVLAKTTTERRQSILEKFAHIPYLNSSLFEPTELEQECLFISQLADDRKMPIISSSVLKDEKGKTRKGDIVTVEYLFEFLNAYDFSSEGAEDIQEENKTLINASVLGLIFEKINGYKDGSFFTPGFITMYMCRETLRRSVVQKFNDAKGRECESIADIYNSIGAKDTAEANEIINSLKVCDPAVGSGHFLVSALNEIIAIKHDLGILQDAKGKKLRDVEVAVVNDELIVKNEDGELYEYNPNNKESQRIQETLFKEKQTIIENCLFGVDINPNSVKICRLRLWIELLKNAYYKPNEVNVNLSSGVVAIKELETLPNIDINIKCGNSLVSRFALDADLKKALKSIKYDINAYKGFVKEYKHATNKEEKHGLEKLIDQVKGNFRTEIIGQDPKVKQYKIAQGKLLGLTTQTDLFGLSAKEKKERKAEIKKLSAKVEKLDKEIEEIKGNKIYENAFEWRFEFPEVLNDKGDFVGFDAVIGNPPYGSIFTSLEKIYIKNSYQFTDYQFDIYMSFFELSSKLLCSNKELCFIVPNTWLLNLKTPNIRKLLFEAFDLNKIVAYSFHVFDEAIVDVLIVEAKKNQPINEQFPVEIRNDHEVIATNFFNKWHLRENYSRHVNIYLSEFASKINQKLSTLIKLDEIATITQGTKPFQKGKGKPKQDEKIMREKPYVKDYRANPTFRPLLRGSLINRYKILWDNNYYISFGEWLAEPRFSANYDAPLKIVIRQTGSSLIATLDNNQFIVRDNLYTITSKSEDYSEYLILAALNSKLLNWYYQNIINNEIGEALAQVKRGHLAQLPVAKINSFLVNEIIENTKLVLSELEVNSKRNVQEKLDKIDQLVYQLYGLTEEEIKMVEESVK